MLLASAQAGQIILPTPLSTLVGTGDFVVVGDITFDSFNYTASGDMPPAATINVLEHVGIDGNPGLRFQGGFTDSTSPGASDALIEFVAKAPAIGSARVTGNPDLLGGTGVAAVTETFLPDITDDSITVYDNGTVEQLTDVITFSSPVSQLSVQKSINLLAEAGGAGASISFVDQTFSVPEPTGSSIVLCGLLAVAVMCRRRN